MRLSLLVVPATLIACTQLNPAFDFDVEVGQADDASGGSGSESGSEGESGDEFAEATSQGEESSDTMLPEQSCNHQPTSGLDLVFGDPEYFGGNCPDSIDHTIRIPLGGGSPGQVEICDSACNDCSDTLPLSIEPLSVIEYLPDDSSTCVRLQADVLLGSSSDSCQWGALSLFDAAVKTPYFIAVTHGADPTSMAEDSLDDMIPDPVTIESCSCDAVGESHDCCYDATTPPEFLAYPWGEEMLMPGDRVPIEIDDEDGLDHDFQVFQAQQLHACGEEQRSLSWAVLADWE